MRDLEADVEIERAITYLVRSVERSGENPKPVVLHSVRVGMSLYRRGYEKRVVIAGLLHDLIEDTAVSADEIESRFGEDVSGIVEATTFDREIEEYTARYRDTFNRCFEEGRDAVLVKAADILDNSDYYHAAESAELRTSLLEKMTYFVDHSEPHIGNEPIHRELREKLREVKETVDGV